MIDHFVWIDPEDAFFVRSCREALKMERKAYAAADAERMALLKRVRELEDEIRQGARAGDSALQQG